MEKIKNKLVGLEIVKVFSKMPYIKQITKQWIRHLFPKSIGNQIVEFIVKTPFLKNTVKEWVETLPNKNKTLPKLMKFSNEYLRISPMVLMPLIM